MIRTHVRLTEEQSVYLCRFAAARRQSVAELIRLSVDLFIEREAGLAQRAKAVADRFSSGSPDGSREHDRYMANASVE